MNLGQNATTILTIVNRLAKYGFFTGRLALGFPCCLRPSSLVIFVSAGTKRQAGEVAPTHDQVASRPRCQAAPIPTATLLHLGPHLLGV